MREKLEAEVRLKGELFSWLLLHQAQSRKESAKYRYPSLYEEIFNQHKEWFDNPKMTDKAKRIRRSLLSKEFLNRIRNSEMHVNTQARAGFLTKAGLPPYVQRSKKKGGYAYYINWDQFNRNLVAEFLMRSGSIFRMDIEDELTQISDLAAPYRGALFNPDYWQRYFIQLRYDTKTIQNRNLRMTCFDFYLFVLFVLLLEDYHYRLSHVKTQSPQILQRIGIIREHLFLAFYDVSNNLRSDSPPPQKPSKLTEADWKGPHLSLFNLFNGGYAPSDIMRGIVTETEILTITINPFRRNRKYRRLLKQISALFGRLLLTSSLMHTHIDQNNPFIHPSILERDPMLLPDEMFFGSRSFSLNTNSKRKRVVLPPDMFMHPTGDAQVDNELGLLRLRNLPIFFAENPYVLLKQCFNQSLQPMRPDSELYELMNPYDKCDREPPASAVANPLQK